MTDKLLSAEELENALFVLDGDASHESDVGHAGRVVRSHISALTEQREDKAAAIDRLTASLSRVEEDNARLVESLGVDKVLVVDDLMAWPGKVTTAPGDARDDAYIQRLMREAAAIIRTGRCLSRTSDT